MQLRQLMTDNGELREEVNAGLFEISTMFATPITEREISRR